MASFISSLTSRDWSPTSLANRLLKPQLLSQGCISSTSIASVSTNSPEIASEDVWLTNSTAAAWNGGPVSHQEMVALGQIFDHFDENKDGKISCGELRRSLGMLGIETNDEELVAMIDSADWNSDGSLDFSEFASFYYSLNEEMGQNLVESSTNNGYMRYADGHDQDCEGEEEDLRNAFRLFDKNGDGYICAEELQSVLASMGLSQGNLIVDCRSMIRSVDVDGDGQVSFDEFKHMMVSGSGQA